MNIFVKHYILTIIVSGCFFLGCSQDKDHADPQTNPVSEDLTVSVPTTEAFPVDEECISESRYFYLLDNKSDIYRFNPDDGSESLEKVYDLTECILTGSPFSMSIDRTNRLWIMSDLGELYWLSLDTEVCGLASVQPKELGITQPFPMTFLSTSQDDPEVLYGTIDHLDEAAPNVPVLYRIDLFTEQLTMLGTMPRGQSIPELTGTSNGRLFAYYPGMESWIREIDTTTGAELNIWDLPQLETRAGQAQSWSFAYWNQAFYIFVTPFFPNEDFSDTRIFKLDPRTGQTSVYLENTSHIFVGAAVSTCTEGIVN